MARQQNFVRTTTKPISARCLHLVPAKKFVSNCPCTVVLLNVPATAPQPSRRAPIFALPHSIRSASSASSLSAPAAFSAPHPLPLHLPFQQPTSVRTDPTYFLHKWPLAIGTRPFPLS